jgi:hypothetical protein
MIGALVVSFIVLILMAVIVGTADAKDQKTTAGFFGNWILLAALAVVGCSGYFALLMVNKAKTQFKDHSAFEVN